MEEYFSEELTLCDVLMRGASGSSTYRAMYVCVTCVFSIRLANSEYPTLVCLKNPLLTSDFIYTGKLEIPSATKEIFMQKYIIPRVLVNYTEKQV